MDEPVKPDILNNQQWQRISPIAVVYFAVAGVKLAINNLIYLLPAIAVSYSSIKDNPSVWAPIGFVLLCLVIGSAALQYMFFTFRSYQGKLEIRTGVFSKTQLDLPFERIQNVSIEQPLYYRATNTVCVILDTAGSAQKEARIVALPAPEADMLKHYLLSIKPTDPSSSIEQATTASSSLQDSQSKQEKVLNTRSISDLVVHGITSNRVWIILGVMAPVYDDIGQFMLSQLERYGVDYQQFLDTYIQGFWPFIVLAMVIAVGLITLVTLISILGSIVIFYDYKLSRTDDKYIQRCGLFTRQEITMKQSRLQVIIAKQDWLDVLLKRTNLYFKQNKSAATHQPGVSDSQKIMVPSISKQQALDLSENALHGNRMFDVTFQPISKRFILRQLMFWLIPLWLIASVVCAVEYDTTALVGCQAVGLTLLALVVLRWKRWGIATDENFTYLTKGLFGSNVYCFSTFKIQQTQFSQGLFMRRNKLANVRFVLASGPIDIPYLNAQQASQYLAQALHHTSLMARSWM